MKNVPVPPPATERGPERSAASEESVGELVGDLTEGLTTLVRQELSLARAELKHEAVRSGQVAGAYGGAGVAALLALVFGSLGSWVGLCEVMHPGWAALTVAVIWAVIGGLLYSSARARSRRIGLAPTRTVDTLGQIPQALRGHRGGTS